MIRGPADGSTRVRTTGIRFVTGGLLARPGGRAGALAALSAAVDAVRATPAWDTFSRHDGHVDPSFDAPVVQSDLAKATAATSDIATRAAHARA
ncbi:MAG TPA: hypothetical protein VKZ50_01895 [bacterium]|nr:hypothetical protein [bacterium]